MRPFHSIAVLAVFASLFPVSIARARSVTVGTECRTIQECVDSVPSGTTVLLPPGVYAEGVRIQDKDLKLVGRPADGQPVTLVPARDQYAIHVERGRVGIRNLATRGGFGLGVVDGEMIVRGVTIRDSVEHGVASKQSKLTITKSQISGEQYYGVQTRGTLLKMKDVTIDGPSGDGVGVYLDNQESAGFLFPEDAGATGLLNNVNVHSHPGGGILIVGSWFTYTIVNSGFYDNGRFGVFLLEADGTVLKKSQATDTVRSFVQDPYEEPPDGDGVFFRNSENVTVDEVMVIGNERAGILGDESSGTVSNNVSILNLYGLVLQGMPTPSYKNLGNNFSPNTKLDILLDGNLPVPSTLSPIPEHP